MVMGRNGYGPKWSWAEIVMCRNDPESCKVLIDKSVPRVTVWHLETLPSDAKLWPEGQTCPSVPYT